MPQKRVSTRAAYCNLPNLLTKTKSFHHLPRHT
ncbi:hypothetical protein IHE45_11G057800 [Dioscorea alata]|uniref:Uncharacterized protein n=1 Tax=Dioscorea alata TaxID=55571 RepID=A0ACB7V6M3_DIOAL|nr:hypothetical protein IHE45_11G057800 [Dioscorea alata]